jgi:hypothetical protein
VEAIECPTMLCSGYGEHNIQGIGDKHTPLIHNVMNTDVVVGGPTRPVTCPICCSAAMSGAATWRAAQDRSDVVTFDDIGIRPANIVAAIKLAKHLEFGATTIMTVATDSAQLYASERQSFLAPPPAMDLMK